MPAGEMYHRLHNPNSMDQFNMIERQSKQMNAYYNQMYNQNMYQSQTYQQPTQAFNYQQQFARLYQQPPNSYLSALSTEKTSTINPIQTINKPNIAYNNNDSNKNQKTSFKKRNNSLTLIIEKINDKNMNVKDKVANNEFLQCQELPN